MDQELITYLEAKFEGIDTYLEAKFEGIDRRFEETRDEIRENRQQIRENREQIRENREQIRGTQVVVEDLRSKIETVAEGHVTLRETMDRRFDEAEADRARSESMIKAAIVNLGEREDELEERFERLKTA